MKVTLRAVCEHIQRCVSEHREQYGTRKKGLLMARVSRELEPIAPKFMEEQDGLVRMLTNLEKPVNQEMLETVLSMYESFNSGEKSLEEAGKEVNQNLNHHYVDPHLESS